MKSRWSLATLDKYDWTHIAIRSLRIGKEQTLRVVRVPIVFLRSTIHLEDVVEAWYEFNTSLSCKRRSPVTHFIMFTSGVGGGGDVSSGVSGMIRAQPESLIRPSIVRRSPPTLPTTLSKLLCDMTSSRSGKTAYLSLARHIPKSVRHTPASPRRS